jgi:adenylyltransferase/sulfurtransferase
MDNQQLLRYSRHLMLPQLDYAGQQKLLQSRVLMIGLGGLGSAASLYLAASGVGELVLNDFDTVDLGNLQRQIVHTMSSIDINKAVSAKQTLAALNPDCHVTEIPFRLDEKALQEQIRLADVVVDCSDNFATRFLLNRLCFETRTPLVSGAAIRYEGQLTVFHYAGQDACYACLYPESDETEEGCTANGVLAPVVGVIGSLQALEAIKVIAGIGETLRNRLLVFDAFTQQYRVVQFSKDNNCRVCGSA